MTTEPENKAKIKARELVKQFAPNPYLSPHEDCDYWPDWQKDVAKESALMCCNEMIQFCNNLSIAESGTEGIDYGQTFYQQVKTEVEKL